MGGKSAIKTKQEHSAVLRQRFPSDFFACLFFSFKPSKIRDLRLAFLFKFYWKRNTLVKNMADFKMQLKDKNLFD